MNTMHEANRRYWNEVAERWERLEEEGGVWQRWPREPELAFAGGALGLVHEVAGPMTGKDVCDPQPNLKVILIGGSSHVGKSTVAESLAGNAGLVTSLHRPTGSSPRPPLEACTGEGVRPRGGALPSPVGRRADRGCPPSLQGHCLAEGRGDHRVALDRYLDDRNRLGGIGSVARIRDKPRFQQGRRSMADGQRGGLWAANLRWKPV